MVTSIADTYHHADDADALSVREAIDLANTAAGAQEIWLPAWDFILTRERTALQTSPETDVDQGDLEIKQSLTIRGVSGATSVAWRSGAAPDKVFELLGDYNDDDITDEEPADVDSADWIIWRRRRTRPTPT